MKLVVTPHKTFMKYWGKRQDPLIAQKRTNSEYPSNWRQVKQSVASFDHFCFTLTLHKKNASYSFIHISGIRLLFLLYNKFVHFLQAENDGRTDEAKGTDAEAATPECDGGSICDVSSFHEFKYFPVWNEQHHVIIQVHDIPIPPDGGWGWMIVLSSFMCSLIVDGIAYTFGVFLPILTVYFGEGKGRVSMIGSLLAGVYLSCGNELRVLFHTFMCGEVLLSHINH